MANVVAPGLIVAGGVYLAVKFSQKPTEQGKRLERNKQWQKSMAKQEQTIESKHQPIVDAKNAIAANNAKMEEGMKAATKQPKLDRFGLIEKWNLPEQEKAVANTSGHRNKAGAGVPSKPSAGPQTATKKDVPLNWNTMMKYAAFNGRKTQYAPFNTAAAAGRPSKTKGNQISFLEWDEVNKKKAWTPWRNKTKADDKIIAFSIKNRNLAAALDRSLVVKGWWNNDVILDYIQHVENGKVGILQYDTESRDDAVQHLKDKQWALDAARKPVPREQPGPQAEDGSQWQPWKCEGKVLKVDAGHKFYSQKEVDAANRAKKACVNNYRQSQGVTNSAPTYAGASQQTPQQAAAAASWKRRR